MAVFQVRLKKQHDTKLITWENRYFVSSDDLATAHSAALSDLVTMEQGLHNAGITIIQVITSDLPPGGDFASSVVSAACSNGVSGDELPGILTLNCVFDVTGFGRPDRKYYHVFWGETGQAGGVWGSTERAAALTTLLSGISAMDLDGAPLCDKDGHQWTLLATVEPQVGHHKFSKRSRRAVAGP